MQGLDNKTFIQLLQTAELDTAKDVEVIGFTAELESYTLSFSGRQDSNYSAEFIELFDGQAQQFLTDWQKHCLNEKLRVTARNLEREEEEAYKAFQEAQVAEAEEERFGRAGAIYNKWY